MKRQVKRIDSGENFHLPIGFVVISQLDDVQVAKNAAWPLFTAEETDTGCICMLLPLLSIAILIHSVLPDTRLTGREHRLAASSYCEVER